MSATESTSLLPRPYGDDERSFGGSHVVFWDGEDDPENPSNWPRARVWGHVALVSLLAFLAPLGATMFAPAIDQVMDDLGATSQVLASLIVSVYVLGWVLGPLVVAPLSEVHGRLPVYTWSGVLYVALTACCAVSPRVWLLVLARFLAGSVGSTPLAIGGGTISDLVPLESRGAALSLYMLGPILGPSVGPLLGGLLTDRLGWRYIFVVLGAAYLAATALQALLMRETYPAAILSARAGRMRLKTGDGRLRSALDAGLTDGQVLARAVTRPARLTALSPVAAALALVSAYVNGLGFLLLTSEPMLLGGRGPGGYGLPAREVGLAFVGYGLGNLSGLACFNLFSDRFVRRQAAAGALRAEHRLAPALAAGPLMAAGFLWFGWSAQAHAHVLVPIAGSGLIGAAGVIFFSSVVGYLIDCFGPHAASAVAANTVVRSVGGTLLPLAGRDLFSALGWGWGSTCLALGALLFTPVLCGLYVYGERIRARRPVEL